MATLYWGGGTGTWNDTNTANWYTDFARTLLSTRAPSAEDDVIFDSASSAAGYTVTISGSRTVCRSCTLSGPASGSLTLAGSNAWYIYGDLTLPATGLTRTFTGAINFWGAGNYSITTNGVALASTIVFAGGGKYTLQDALNNGSSSIIVGVNGLLTPGAEFDTNGKTVTCGNFLTNGAVSTVVTLGASTVTCTNLLFNANCTINAGTSTINISGNSASIGNTPFTGATFYDVNFTGTARTSSDIRGNNSFNNLNLGSYTTLGTVVIRFSGNCTVNGTLTVGGASANQRVLLASSEAGVVRTLTVAAVSTLSDVDFQDITIAGTSSPWSGTRLGNAGGNTGVTFSAGINKYLAAGIGNSNCTDNIWATSSGGAASVNNYPLPQDTIVIDNAGMNSGATLTFPNPGILYIGGLDASGRTNAITITSFRLVLLSGDLTLSSAVTLSSPSLLQATLSTSQNLTSAGKTFPAIQIVSTASGILKLTDDLNTGNNAITVISGTFDANNKNVTSGAINTIGNLTKTITLGSGTITCPTVGSSSIALNTTVTANTATIVINSTTGAVIGVNGVTTSFGGSISVTSASAGTTVYGNVTVAGLTLTSPTVTGVTNKLTLGGSLTVTGTLALAGGTSVTQRAFVRSDTIGTQRTLSAATVTGLTDIDFRDINATGTANWTSGTRLGDCGGNAGITFPAAKMVYWNLAGAQNWSATAWASSSGGTPATNNFPLAQDTAVFDNAGSAGTVTLQAFNIGTISAGSRTNAWTLAGSAAVNIYGDVTYGSGTTPSATSNFTFSGTGTQTFTTAGKTVTLPVLIDKPSGVFQHGDALIGGSASGITVIRGNYNTQNYNVTCQQFLSNTSAALRSITLGTSTLTLSFGTNPFILVPTNLTFSAASSTILLSGTGNKTFAGGGLTYGTLSSTGGTGVNNPLTITGSNTFATLTNTAYTNVLLALGTTQTITTLSYSGASGSVVSFQTTVPGQRALLKLSANNIGANSIDDGNNVGLSFTGSSPDYLRVRDIQYVTPVLIGAVSEITVASDSIAAFVVISSAIAELATSADSISAVASVPAFFSDTVTVSDTNATSVTFTPSVLEIATGLDAFSVAGSIFVSTTSELAAAADVVSARGALVSSTSELAAAADAVSARGVLVSTTSELAAAADALTAQMSFVSSTSELAAAADAVSARGVLVSTTSELAAAADAVSTRGVLVSTTSELAAAADEVSARGVLVSSTSETATGLDAFSVAGSIFVSTTSELAAAADAVSARGVLVSSTSETATILDAFTAQMRFASTTSELAVAADAVSARGVLVSSTSETATSADTVTTTTVFSSGFLDTATGSDALVARLVALAAFSDASIGADASITRLVVPASFSDTTTGADTVAARLVLPVSVSETVTSSDAFTASAIFVSLVNESTTALDAAVVVASIFNAGLSEIATGADLFTPRLVIPATFMDTATGSDALVAKLIVPANFSDAATGVDALETNLILSAAFSDTTTCSDTVAARLVLPVVFSDMAVGSDLIAASAIFVPLVNEAITALDAAVVVASIFTSRLSEAATGLDSSAVAGATFNVSLSDSGAITDLIVGGYLWNPVDDSQSPNWQNVVTTQSPGWAEVPNAQSPGWVEVQT